jgi:hypothetical protein
VKTPGLTRRAFSKAAQWRLLVLAPLVLLVPTMLSLTPLLRFFGDLLDHAIRWKEVTPRLDSQAAFGILKQLTPPVLAQIQGGLQAGLLTTLLLAPFLKGAALTAAREDEPQRLRALFQGGGALYGRMFRTQLVGAIPYGIAAGIAAGLGAAQTKLADRAITEGAAALQGKLFGAATFAVFLLAGLALDSGRALLVAQPARKSALVAFGAGLKLVVRRPWESLWLALAPALAGLGLAALVMIVRLQLTQSGGGTVLLAALLGLVASACVSFASAARLCGLVELAQSDLAERARRHAPFEMEPPKTSPPPPREPALPEPSTPAVEVQAAPAEAIAAAAAAVEAEVAAQEPDPVALVSPSTDTVAEAAGMLFGQAPAGEKPAAPAPSAEGQPPGGGSSGGQA